MESFDFSNYVDAITSNWQGALIIGLIAFILARYLRQLISIAIGYILGTYIVLPYLMSRFPSLRMLAKDGGSLILIEIVVGLISAIILYAVFKIFIFLAGVLVIGAISYYILVYIGKLLGVDSFINRFSLDPNLVYLILAVALGAVGGFIAQKREKEISIFTAVVASSLILSVVISYLLLKPFDVDLKGTLGMYTMLGVAIVLFFLGLKFNFSGSRKETKTNR